MKITVITVTYNSKNTIEETIKSVISQNYQDIEYIIIDGLSTDGTIKLINKYKNSISKFISEPDNGMYDAINKGIKLSTGEVIGILNSDDVFANSNILNLVVDSFNNNKVDSIIGDVAFVKNKKIKRKISSLNWSPKKFVKGYAPPHPSFYCKKDIFIKNGYYRTDFEICADYELLIRFLKIQNISYYYLDTIMVLMSLGGKSTSGVASTIKINKEIVKACKINGLKTNYLKLYIRYFKKIFEFINS